MKKFVVLEHLIGRDKGGRFWSMNGPDPEKLLDGTVAYKIILETDSEEEAIAAARVCNFHFYL